MTPSFRVSDALRCIILNQPAMPNLANPRLNGGGTPRLQSWRLWRQAAAQRGHRITLARWNGRQPAGLVSARAAGRPDAAPTCWEIDHFYLPSETLDPDAPAQRPSLAGLELLEQLVSQAGCRGAERVLLRLPSGSPATKAARQAGFFPCYQETRLEGWPQPAPGNGHHPCHGFRVSQPLDQHGLFQLFAAATPAPVRMALAPTLERWREVQRLWPGHRREWVKEHDSRIAGWLGLFQGRDALEGRIMAHPDRPGLSRELLDLAFSRPGFQRWLAPDYQPETAAMLRQRGLADAGAYQVLINPVAKPVESYAMTPVEA